MTRESGPSTALVLAAVEHVLISRRASLWSLQVQFRLDLGTAGRVMDRLEYLGIIGPFLRSDARQVLVPEADALEILLQIGRWRAAREKNATAHANLDIFTIRASL